MPVFMDKWGKGVEGLGRDRPLAQKIFQYEFSVRSAFSNGRVKSLRIFQFVIRLKQADTGRSQKILTRQPNGTPVSAPKIL